MCLNNVPMQFVGLKTNRPSPVLKSLDSWDVNALETVWAYRLIQNIIDVA